MFWVWALNIWSENSKKFNVSEAQLICIRPFGFSLVQKPKMFSLSHQTQSCSVFLYEKSVHQWSEGFQVFLPTTLKVAASQSKVKVLHVISKLCLRSKINILKLTLIETNFMFDVKLKSPPLTESMFIIQSFPVTPRTLNLSWNHWNMNLCHKHQSCILVLYRFITGLLETWLNLLDHK